MGNRVFSAIKYDGKNYNKIVYDFSDGVCAVMNGELKIKTLEGTRTVNIGDFIIKGGDGEFYLCREDNYMKIQGAIK